MTLLLDSGAFSVKSGTKIDPEAYTKYCSDNAAYFEKVVALDKIPKRKTRTQFQRCARLSHARWMRMWDVDAMPVFHYGEPWFFLERYAATCDWVGLASGRADSRCRYDWLDEAWARLAKYPNLRVHGFAETRLRVVLSHPWYSVDSRTATHCALKGQIFVPMRNHDTGRLTLGLYFIGPGVTARHAARHYAAQPRADRDAIRARVEALDFTIEQLSEDKSAYRARYNAAEYDRFVLARQPGLRIFHATSPSGDPFKDQPQPRDRLLSYAFLRNARNFDLRAYAAGLK